MKHNFDFEQCSDENPFCVPDGYFEKFDIWCACTTQDEPVRDWVRLAVARARATGAPAVFWLDPARSHDRIISELVRRYLAEEDTEGLDIRILDPVAATRLSLGRARRDQDTSREIGRASCRERV